MRKSTEERNGAARLYIGMIVWLYGMLIHKDGEKERRRLELYKKGSTCLSIHNICTYMHTHIYIHRNINMHTQVYVVGRKSIHVYCDESLEM